MSDKNKTYLNLNEAAYNVMSGKTPEPEVVNEEMQMRMPRPPGSPPPVPMPKYHPTRPPSRPTGNPPSVPPKGPVPFRKGVEGEVGDDPFLDPFGGLGGPDPDGPFPILTPQEPIFPPEVAPFEHPYRKPYPGIPEIPGSDPNYYDPYGDHDGDGIPNVYDSDNRYFHPYHPTDPREPEMVDPFPALPRPGFVPGYYPGIQDPGVNPFHTNPPYPLYTPDPDNPFIEGEAMRKGSEEEYETDPFGGLIPGVPYEPEDPLGEPDMSEPPNPFDGHPLRMPFNPNNVQPGDPNYYSPYGDHDGDGIPNAFDPDNRYYHPYSPPDEPEMVDPFPYMPRPGYIPGYPHPGGYHPAPQDPGVNPFHRNPYYIPPGGTPTDPNYPEGYEGTEGEVAGSRQSKKRRGVYDPSNVRRYTGIPPEPPAPPQKAFQRPIGTGAKTTPTGGSEGEVMPKAGRMRLDRRGRGY